MTVQQDSSRNADGTFAKGHSGNQGGPPKRDWTWASLIVAAVEEEGRGGDPKKKLVVEKLVALAMKGDTRAIGMMMDRMDGKPRQAVDYTKRDPDEVQEIGFEE